MKENIIQSKTYQFALQIVFVCRKMIIQNNEYVLSRQLMRSGTSIGANVEEAIGGQSKKDFHAKITIAYKEARETLYWLRLIKDSKLIDPTIVEPLFEDILVILKILNAIQRTTRLTINKKTDKKISFV